MISKIVLTLEQDEERGTNEAMEETIQMLSDLDALPMMKFVVTLECEEVSAERVREKLRHGLRTRPIGIIAKIKTTSEEQVTREVMRPTTPMDDLLGESVTLSSGGRSVTLTAETGARAKEWAENARRLHKQESEPTTGEKALEWLEAREQD